MLIITKLWGCEKNEGGNIMRYMAIHKMVQIPGSAACLEKANSGEASAGARKEGLIQEPAGSLRRWGTLLTKTIVTSQHRQGCYEWEGKARTKETRGGCGLWVLCVSQHSLLWEPSQSQSSRWFGFCQWKVSKSPGTQMPEGWSLFLLKLASRIL